MHINKTNLTFSLLLSLLLGALFVKATSFVFVVIIFSLITILLNLDITKSIIFTLTLFPFNNIVTLNIAIIDIRLMEILWLIILFSLFVKKAVGSIRPPVSTGYFVRYDTYLLIFLLICLFQFFVFPYKLIVLKETFQWIYLFSIFIFSRNIFSKRLNIQLFLKFMAVNIVIFLLFGYLKFFWGQAPFKAIFIDVFAGKLEFITSQIKLQRTVGQNLSMVRADSFFLGSVGTVNLLIIMYFFITLISRTFKLSKQVEFAFKILIILFLILTGSRAGWLFFSFLLLLDALCTNKKRWLKIFFAIGIVYFSIQFIPWIKDRIAEVSNTNESSIKSHFAIWSFAIDIFKTHPIIGIGTGYFRYHPLLPSYFQSHNLTAVPATPHNFILKIISENGTLGLTTIIFFFIAFFSNFRRLFNKLKNKEETKMVLFAVLGAFLMNLTMNAFMIESFWVLLGFFAGMTVCVSKEKNGYSHNK